MGFDASPGSEQAVRWAVEEARLRRCELRVIFACHPPFVPDGSAGWMAWATFAAVVDAARRELDGVCTELAVTHPDVEVVADCSTGPAWSALVDDARPDDLIVVGASAHAGPAAFWLGSTPRAVVRHAACPVVVARGSDMSHRPDRVVVGVDGSATADVAVRWALEQAELLGSPVTLVHAWEYPYSDSPVGVPRAAFDFAAAQLRDLTQVDAACLLEHAVDRARRPVSIEVAGVLVEGSPVSGLLSFLQDGDLLVIGYRGRGTFGGGLGSTANALLDRANVPVVVVRDR